jgi:hypothetical protein
MFDATWEWAGQYRLTEKNIGVPIQITSGALVVGDASSPSLSMYLCRKTKSLRSSPTARSMSLGVTIRVLDKQIVNDRPDNHDICPEIVANSNEFSQVFSLRWQELDHCDARVGTLAGCRSFAGLINRRQKRTLAVRAAARPAQAHSSGMRGESLKKIETM